MLPAITVAITVPARTEESDSGRHKANHSKFSFSMQYFKDRYDPPT
jgi:hypothetical protein